MGVVMASVHIRRLDDAVVARLKLRAAANNRSLEGEVRHILEQSVGGAEDKVERVRRFRESLREIHAEIDWSKLSPQTPSEALIRESRDAGYGSSRCA